MKFQILNVLLIEAYIMNIRKNHFDKQQEFIEKGDTYVYSK